MKVEYLTEIYAADMAVELQRFLNTKKVYEVISIQQYFSNGMHHTFVTYKE